MGEKLWKSQVFLSGINRSKKVTRTWKIMKEVVQDLTDPMKMLKKCGIWCIQTVNEAYYVEILERLREAVSRIKGLNFGPTIGFSTMTMLQFSRSFLSSSFWL
jgi:hypothetical protein